MPLAASLDHVGPMTRSAVDAALMFEVMGGGPSPRVPARRWRVGVARAHFFETLDPEIATALDRALTVLERLGCELRDVGIPADTDTTIFRGEAWEEYGARAAATPELFQPETLRRIRAGAEVGADLLASSRRALAETRAGAAALFENVDLLVTPTTVVPAFEVGDPPQITPDLRDRELVSLRNTRPFNALGLPSLSVPCGATADGLPIGLQITGAPQAEATVLALADGYERAAGERRALPLG
jgi:Asp-tRNA(Asn)/Glu-tRNA(Gln) amidotransferase A subunit family amidase